MVVVGTWPEDKEVGYVYHYYLAPSFRGLGLAADMDAHAVQTLLRAGYSMARLSVAETNTRARRFYLRQGWSHVGPRPDQPGILYMHRTLARPSARKFEVSRHQGDAPSPRLSQRPASGLARG
jgi:RimJ/RimL family protein N-acetyltransferase